MVVFLEKVHGFENPLAKKYVRMMGDVYGFDKSQNIEIVSRYFRVGLRAEDEAVYEPTAELLGKTGRMKFVGSFFLALQQSL